jgi:hypothetical protein
MKMTQKKMCIAALDKVSAMDRAVMDMINCKENPMTNADLESLIKRKPDVYGKYRGLVGKLKES